MHALMHSGTVQKTGCNGHFTTFQVPQPPSLHQHLSVPLNYIQLSGELHQETGKHESDKEA